MNTPLAVASVAEAGTGLSLLLDPFMVIRLLFGTEITVTGVIVSRIAGISLIALGVACWPNENRAQPLYGMLTYNFLAALYLLLLAISGIGGTLLWPAVVVHAVFAALLVRVRLAR